mgnify:FL=1|jgi:hypothetical protein|tara:strand:+ start:375 stop:557 length:183 start_codon:yes stop_codon:yes gene_type:complete
MGHYEDFWYEVTESIEREGLKKQFDEQLKKMNNQDKHKYKDSKDRWSYAYDKVKSQKKKT